MTSASYNAIHDKNELLDDGNQLNSSWSRIRVFFPMSSYRRHEHVIHVIYTAVSDIGGITSIYLRLSGVTIFQVVFYGIKACRGARKPKHRVDADKASFFGHY